MVFLQRFVGRALGTRSSFLENFWHSKKSNYFPVQRYCSQSNVTGDKGIKKGVIADRTPVKVRCEGGKTYSWCACGLSVKQPLCDGTHKKSDCGLKPFRFTAPETKDYLFCNCKQTNNPPFCDGSHKKCN